MKNPDLRWLLIFTSLCFILDSAPVHAKKVYRWLDDQGDIYFSDQVPPEHIQHSRATLSQTGRVLEVTEQAQSKEQIEQENRLQELRRQQEKLIASQKVHDKALLSSYHSKEDMLLAIQSKMEVFDKQKDIFEGNIERLTEQLKKQQHEVSVFESNAQEVPKDLLNEMVLSQTRLTQIQNALRNHLEKQEQIKKVDEADVARFLFLTQTTKDVVPRAKIPSIKEANELGLFYCENDYQCNKAWEIGRNFVNFYSTTEADVYNDKLIMNRPPPKDTDISLSLSKLAINEDDYQIFLDIRCRPSLMGELLCASPKIKAIRSSFRSYINDALSRGALNSKVPTP
jgi:Domain of unknown function (DUF4124)